jgi:hypothetical protein
MLRERTPFLIKWRRIIANSLVKQLNRYSPDSSVINLQHVMQINDMCVVGYLLT